MHLLQGECSSQPRLPEACPDGVGAADVMDGSGTTIPEDEEIHDGFLVEDAFRRA